MPDYTLRDEDAARVAGLTFLIAEDDPVIALELEDLILDLGGAVVGPFACLSKLMKASGQPRADVALLDVRLGREECYPAAARLIAAGVPVVFHSGHATRAQLEARFPGAAACAKPCTPDRLIAAALRVLEAARAHASRAVPVSA